MTLSEYLLFVGYHTLSLFTLLWFHWPNHLYYILPYFFHELCLKIIKLIILTKMQPISSYQLGWFAISTGPQNLSLVRSNLTNHAQNKFWMKKLWLLEISACHPKCQNLENPHIWRLIMVKTNHDLGYHLVMTKELQKVERKEGEGKRTKEEGKMSLETTPSLRISIFLKENNRFTNTEWRDTAVMLVVTNEDSLLAIVEHRKPQDHNTGH